MTPKLQNSLNTKRAGAELSQAHPKLGLDSELINKLNWISIDLNMSLPKVYILGWVGSTATLGEVKVIVYNFFFLNVAFILV